MACPAKQRPSAPLFPVYLPLLCLCLALLLGGGEVRGQTGEDISRLLQDLVRINSRVRPVRNHSTVTTVYVEFHLMAIINFETKDQKLVSNGWLRVMWNNEYGTWDPRAYNNTYSVFPDPEIIWRPRLTILNSMKELRPIGEDYVMITSMYDGTTMWLPAERFETSCKVDVTYFPFDTQTCTWDMINWGSDDYTILDLESIYANISLESYAENGEYELIGTTMWKDIDVSGLSSLHYQVTIRRRPSLLALTVVLPVVVIAVVNVFVFAIPAESGERISYTMTALLSFGVFMSFILDSMPSSTETLSIMAVNLSCLLVLSAMLVLLCIYSLRLFHRDDLQQPVTPAWRSALLWLELLLCLAPPSIHRTKARDIIPVKTVAATPASATLGQDFGDSGDLLVGVGGRGLLKRWSGATSKSLADPEKMTWKQVSRSLDRILLRFFLLVVMGTNVAVWVVMAWNFYSVNKTV